MRDRHADGRLKDRRQLNGEVKEVDEEGALHRVSRTMVGHARAQGLAKILMERGHQLVNLNERTKNSLLFSRKSKSRKGVSECVSE